MKKAILNLLKFYKIYLSPLLGVVFCKACRFYPTCSEYTAEAIQKFGISKGLIMGLKRLSKCHPLGGSGFDPVPGN